MITAKIETPEETYHIEPSWRHISDSEPETMIAYKESDINFRYKSWRLSHGQKTLKLTRQ